MSADNCRWMLEHCAPEHADAAEFLAYVRDLEAKAATADRLAAKLAEADIIIANLRHAIAQLQRSEDRAHGLDTESSDWAGALYAQSGRNEVLR